MSVTISIPDEFERQARVLLEGHPELRARWTVISEGLGRELFIPKQEPAGFDVTVQAETHGLYLFADSWHGGPWESSPDDPSQGDEQVRSCCTELLGFVRTLLCADASLEVHFAGSRPYKWILSFETELGRQSEGCSLLFFNYFGKRRVETLQNRHLPRRYHPG